MEHFQQLIYVLGMIVIYVFCISVMIIVTFLLNMQGIILPLLGLYVVAQIMGGVRNANRNNSED